MRSVVKPIELHPEFPSKLRAAMSERQLSNSELARRVWGKDKNGRARNVKIISRYLAGKSFPVRNLRSLASALDVPVAALHTVTSDQRWIPKPHQPHNVEEENNLPNSHIFKAIWRALTPDARNQVVDLMVRLISKR